MKWSNVLPSFLGGRVVTAERQGKSWWYSFKGDTVELPFKTNFEIFRGIPHLGAVIGKKAELYSNARFEIVKTNKEDEIDYDHPLNEILSNPNIWQSWRQMLYMLSIYKSVAGVAFMYPGFGLDRAAKYLAFLRPVDFELFEVDKNKNSLPVLSNDLKEAINFIRFTFQDGTKSIKYNPEELITLKDTYYNYVDNYSRITMLAKPIENIYKVLVARGVLADKKGGIGILAGGQKDGGVAVPLKPEDKRDIQNTLDDYGLGIGKRSIQVTDVPLTWQPMVFPTNTLMLYEDLLESFCTVCDVYGVHREVFLANTTFSNKEQATKATYVDTIVPEWWDLFDMLNKSLNLTKEKRRLKLTVQHIPYLAENEKEIVAVASSRSNMHIRELDKRLISKKMYYELMGYDATKFDEAMKEIEEETANEPEQQEENENAQP